jgi:hypothetical protein
VRPVGARAAPQETRPIFGPTRRTTHAATGPTCADVGPRRPSPSRRTGFATAGNSAPGAVGHRSSTGADHRDRHAVECGSIVSSATEPWRRDTTSSPSARGDRAGRSPQRAAATSTFPSLSPAVA